MIHLDTNVMIGLFNPGAEYASFGEALREGESAATSAVAWYEFVCGPFPPGSAERLLALLEKRIEPVEQHVAEFAAILFNKTGRRRGSDTDCLIAATAITHEAKLFTFNTADFARFQPYGLELFD